jgi:hypothetical protein
MRRLQRLKQNSKQTKVGNETFEGCFITMCQESVTFDMSVCLHVATTDEIKFDG